MINHVEMGKFMQRGDNGIKMSRFDTILKQIDVKYADFFKNNKFHHGTRLNMPDTFGNYIDITFKDDKAILTGTSPHMPTDAFIEINQVFNKIFNSDTPQPYIAKNSPKTGGALIKLNIITQERVVLENLNGLIDTGASISAVKEGVLKQAGIDITTLPTINRNTPAGLGQSHIIKDVIVYFEPWSEIRIPLKSLSTFNGGSCDVLIGCDLLSLCRFTYNGPAESYILTLVGRQ